MTEYANYIGNKISNITEIKEEFDNFNHLIQLNHTQVFSINLRGWFYFNLITGDNYVISEYGIAKFTKSGMDWAINEESTVLKFMKVNRKVSENYIDKPSNTKLNNNIREKLGF